MNDAATRMATTTTMAVTTTTAAAAAAMTTTTTTCCYQVHTDRSRSTLSSNASTHAASTTNSPNRGTPPPAYHQTNKTKTHTQTPHLSHTGGRCCVASGDRAGRPHSYTDRLTRAHLFMENTPTHTQHRSATRTHTRTHMHRHMHTHKRTYTHIHTDAHTCTHAHTNAQTRTRIQTLR